VAYASTVAIVVDTAGEFLSRSGVERLERSVLLPGVSVCLDEAETEDEKERVIGRHRILDSGFGAASGYGEALPCCRMAGQRSGFSRIESDVYSQTDFDLCSAQFLAGISLRWLYLRFRPSRRAAA
jgi:hypothetical protein